MNGIILLLGKNDAVEEYAKKILKIDMQNDIVYYPDVTTHYTELDKFVDLAKAETPPVITTQRMDMVDALLESDLNLIVVTVKRKENRMKYKTMIKEDALELRRKYKCELR